MQIKKAVTFAMAMILTFTFIISLPFSVSADEEDTEDAYSKALAAFKEDMSDPYTINTVESAYLYCISTESELLYFDASPNKKENPADTAKMLTALTAYDLIEDMSEAVTVTQTMVNESTGVRYDYKRGDVVSYRDLLKTLIVRNANDAAVVLAYSLCGSIPEFSVKMNAKAKEIGLTESHFTNPTGTYDSRTYTTARDIFLLANEFYKNETLMSYARASYLRLDDNKIIHSRNFLLSNYYNTGSSYIDSSVSGITASTSNEGGYAIARSASYDGYEYICIILGAKRDTYFNYSYLVSGELIKWGAKNFSFSDLLSTKIPIASVPVKSGRETDSVPIVPRDNFSKYMLTDAAKSGKLKSEIKLDVKELRAPVAKGTEVGTVYLYYDGELLATSTLETACEITENTTSAIIETVWETLSSKKAITAYIVIASCVTAYVLLNSVFRYHRKIRRERDGAGSIK